MRTKAQSYTYVKRARDKKRLQLQSLKEGRPCSDCGDYLPHYCLDWHHEDKLAKEFPISKAMRDNVSWERIHQEIEKCVLLCKNCHAKIEWEETRSLIVQLP